MIVGALDGPLRSSVKTWPVKLPFPTPVPPSLLPATSAIESLSTRFSPSVPSPDPVDELTVYAVPEPVTPVRLAVASPTFASAKSPVSTPDTASLNVTVHETFGAFVGEVPTRVIDATEGFVASMTHVRDAGPEVLPLESTARTWKV